MGKIQKIIFLFLICLLGFSKPVEYKEEFVGLSSKFINFTEHANKYKFWVLDDKQIVSENNILLASVSEIFFSLEFVSKVNTKYTFEITLELNKWLPKNYIKLYLYIKKKNKYYYIPLILKLDSTYLMKRTQLKIIQTVVNCEIKDVTDVHLIIENSLWGKPR